MATALEGLPAGRSAAAPAADLRPQQRLLPRPAAHLHLPGESSGSSDQTPLSFAALAEVALSQALISDLLDCKLNRVTIDIPDKEGATDFLAVY